MASTPAISICTFDDVLADGTAVHVRPISPSDKAALAAFHEGLSPESVYRRFFNAHPHLTEEEATRFTTVDFQNRLAMVAIIDGKLVAVARFDRINLNDPAELAFVVADAYQGRGLGTLLLKALVCAGRELGIRRFVADTLSTNQPMRDVFRGGGFQLSQSFRDGVVHVEFPIAERRA